MRRPPLNLLLFGAGLILIGVNIAGRFSSLHNPAIYDEAMRDFARYRVQPLRFSDVVTLRPDGLKTAARRAAGESDQQYATRLTTAVYRAMPHYWYDDVDKYRLRVPLTENYLLYVASFVMPAKFLRYEFYDEDKAIERAVGFCSQHASVLARLLEREGIATRVLIFYRHTFVTAQVDRAADTWWILDPNYGVVIPHPFEDLSRDPSRIVPFYLDAGFTRAHIDRLLVPTFGSSDYRDVTGAAGYHRWRSYYEPAAYILIWVIPAGLLVLGRGALAVRRRPGSAIAAAPGLR